MSKTKTVTKTEGFGERVRDWRKNAGMTQSAAAQAIAKAADRAVSFPLYQKIEYGWHDPAEWFVIAFANASGQNVNDLLKLAGLPQIEKAALPLA
jgi:transcriptional regulator with XRE-family HTH domain